LERTPDTHPATIEEVLQLDQEARRAAARVVAGLNTA
jgi:hypothetical protein